MRLAIDSLSGACGSPPASRLARPVRRAFRLASGVPRVIYPFGLRIRVTGNGTIGKAIWCLQLESSGSRKLPLGQLARPTDEPAETQIWEACTGGRRSAHG